MIPILPINSRRVHSSLGEAFMRAALKSPSLDKPVNGTPTLAQRAAANYLDGVSCTRNKYPKGVK